jgi:eukaryotic-like serine/threonine-protein kinase
MTLERWERIRKIFDEASARPPEERATLLNEACGGDAELRAEVETLLNSADAAGSDFLESPDVLGLVGASLAGEGLGSVADSVGLAPGSRLGSYEILELLGAGGMGEVYRARDTRLGRAVAIKVLPPGASADPARRRRFEQEGRAVAALNDPRICTLYDIGREGEIDFLVMELVAGETLTARLRRAPLPRGQAIELGTQMALALSTAHAAGIVHRDLKPGNVMLTESGVKLLDFGLAKLLPTSAPAAEGSARLTEEFSVTGQRAIIGTLAYMAPEQLEGKAVDARTDLFAFGALFYEMLTGRRAFGGATQASVITAIMSADPPPLSSFEPLPPPALERVVRRCLAKDPRARWQSAADLADELKWISSGSGSPAAGAAPDRAPKVRRRVPLWALAAVSLALAAGFFARARTASTAKSEPAIFRRLTFRPGNVLSARFAPDGQTVVYGAAWEGNPAEIFSVRTDSMESRSQGVSRANVLSISSRGELALLMKKGSYRVAEGKGTLARMPLGSSTPREVLEDVLLADWAPNGEDMAVLRLTPEGKNRLEYPIGHRLDESSSFRSSIRVSPSGDLVAYAEYGEDKVWAVRVIDRKGGKRTLTNGSLGWDFGGLAWSRAGGEILFVAGKTNADEALRAVSLSGRERVLLSSAGGSLYLHDVAADGRLLLERQASRIGIACLPPGENRERELGWLDDSRLRDLSEDGRTILFFEGANGHGARENGIFLRNTDGSPAVRLGDGDPQALSPDGKWALSLTPTSPPELELLPTGPGSPKKVPVEGIGILSARFLPDGRIVVVRRAPGALLSVVNPDGGPTTNISSPGYSIAGGYAFSPDSKLAAYATKERRITIVPIAGGPPRVVPGEENNDLIFQWSSDGRSLFTIKDDDIPARIWRVDIETGRKTLWKEIQPADTARFIGFYRFKVTRDGRAYAYSSRRMESSDLYVAEGLK